MKVPCRHCGTPVDARNARRGLCDTCRKDPKIQQVYLPPGAQSLKRTAGERLPDKPTNAEPGSIEKIRVMMQRVALRQTVDHPKDLRYEVEADAVEFRPHRLHPDDSE